MKVGLVKIGLKGENNEISKIGVWLAPRKKDYRNQSLQSIKVAKLQKIKIAEINQSCKIAKNQNCKINYDMAFQHARPLRGSADKQISFETRFQEFQIFQKNLMVCLQLSLGLSNTLDR